MKQSSLESDDLAVTQQISNPKTESIIPPTVDNGSRLSVSSIQNSSLVHKARISTTFTSNVKTDKEEDEFISLTPEDTPL